MKTAFFNEVQTLRQHSWIWLLLLGCVFAANLPIVVGLYSQVFQGVPWGNEPMPDEGLILVLILMLVISGFVIAVIYSTRLETRIDSTGIHYKFFPHQCKWQAIVPEEISGYKVRKLGFFRSIILKKGKTFSKTKNMVNLLGTTQLVVDLKTGKQIIIGTENPEGVEWAMKRLFHRNQIF